MTTTRYHRRLAEDRSRRVQSQLVIAVVEVFVLLDDNREQWNMLKMPKKWE
jgi:hypothetical protein